MRVNDVFCAVSLSSPMAKSWLADPSIAHGVRELPSPQHQLLQPPLRRHLRQAQRGRDHHAPEAPGGHPFNGEEFLCRSHHFARNCLQTHRI